jgi:wyosine [tRNA(Phe)-imidazoG37] synthetase (radical SAM superfamily)
VLDAVQARLEKLKGTQEVDYLTFVPDGEPTLDRHLGREIALLKGLGLPVAVITNASLLWRADVREELAPADWISVKVDAVVDDTWRQVNRPHRRLDLDAILDGVLRLAATHRGVLVTETMLVSSINDGEEHLGALARFLSHLRPSTAYLSAPTRPPAEAWVRPADPAALNRAYQILSASLDRVETLTGHEGDGFGFTGDAEHDLLGITAVHPMRQDSVAAFLARAGAPSDLPSRLVARGELARVDYQGHTFYLRAFPSPGRPPVGSPP